MCAGHSNSVFLAPTGVEDVDSAHLGGREDILYLFTDVSPFLDHPDFRAKSSHQHPNYSATLSYDSTYLTSSHEEDDQPLDLDCALEVYPVQPTVFLCKLEQDAGNLDIQRRYFPFLEFALAAQAQYVALETYAADRRLRDDPNLIRK